MVSLLCTEPPKGRPINFARLRRNKARHRLLLDRGGDRGIGLLRRSQKSCSLTAAAGLAAVVARSLHPMRSLFDLSRWLSLFAIALLAVSSAHAVMFADGQVHVIAAPISKRTDFPPEMN